jgi:ferritin-like metal-binding protein YciE
MPDEKPNARDAKVIHFLSEAYGNEKRLETALAAHIEMAERATYKRRLRDHLTETKRHSRELERRIKQLGGHAEELAIPGPSGLADIAGAVVSGMHKASALAQAPLHALRGTGSAERQLKNARTEYAEEAQEIGIYSAMQRFAEKVGDRETATLARAILREEQRMASFLEKEIGRLATAVATAEVPARLRNGGTRRRRRTTRRASTASGATAARRTSRPSSRSTARRTSSGSTARRTSAPRRAASASSSR